ncbi:MAG: hypothetical protein KF901_24480, partial [Myxococcales bacterium]|nr:hypothetical protein [Myxococcales bacterium]
RTMLGVTAPTAPTAPSAPAAGPTASAGPRPAPQTNRTMLGVTAPSADASPTTPTRPEPQTHRTMLGVTAPTAPATGGPATGGPATGAAASSWDSQEAMAVVRPSSGRGVLWLGVGLVVLALVAGAAAFLLWPRGPDVRISVGQSEAGEVLVVEVPGAVEGTRVRFSGEERALDAGRAEFPLRADALSLGDNTVAVAVVEPGGKSESVEVLLSLRYRVRADLSALQQDPPVLRIVVDAPGAQATLDEQPVTLDASGHGVVDFPLDAAPDAPSYARQVHFRVVMPNEAPAEGDVRVSIPFTTLQLDRPGRRAITDRERIEVAGVADPEATVTLDGRALELREGRFVTELALDALGESEHAIVARRAGRAPRRVTFQVRRVRDLAAEAAAYPTEALTYARLAAAPNTYRGRRVRFDGRIYNVDVHEGTSILQVLVQDCPRGQRCPLWITYEGATEAGLNEWVRAIGELAGEQQFRSPAGEVLSVPRLDAVFLLPIQGGG